MSQTSTTLSIESGRIYHIYNHAVGSENLFRNHYDYLRFINDWQKRMPGIAEVYAYCLLPNHFHMMLKVIALPKQFSDSLGVVCNAYSKYFNNKYKRMGSLFVKPFKRRIADSDKDLAWLPWYIHRNPLHHKISLDGEHYQWSSFPEYVAGKSALVNFDFLLNFFGGLDAMVAHHKMNEANWNKNGL
jgi:REP element-mobilizing transposase RayT